MANGETRPFVVECRALSDTCTAHEIKNGDSFQDEFFMVYQRRLEDVRKLLKSSEELEDQIQSLVSVDAIQRLGIDYHFQDEIEAILMQHYSITSTRFHGSLHDFSLFFRLLRQQGHCISADMFNNFKGKHGGFYENLREEDIRGLIELHEAAQLGLEGEDILDEAAKFSSQILHERLTGMDYTWSNVVSNRLKYPYHKSIARFTATNCIEDFPAINGWGKTLTDLAKMDFHMGQTAHKQEFLQISKWWKDLGLAEEFKQSRNQPLKWYTWSMAALIDPSMSEERIELTKPITFVYVIDDIFDLYGTLDELTLFTEAVNKWDYAAIDMLPKPLKICYKALLDTTNELAYTVYKKHGYNPIDSLKSAWASLCDAFLIEARWFASGHLPTANDYLENGKVSSGVHVVLVHLFFLLGVGKKTKGTVNLQDVSEFMSSVATILRLWDDLGSAKDEQQDGNDGSFIECYMKEHTGSSVEKVREQVVEMISIEWKLLNKECFRLNQYSASSFTQASLNLARMIPLMYTYNDNQRLPILEKYIKSTLLHDKDQE